MKTRLRPLRKIIILLLNPDAQSLAQECAIITGSATIYTAESSNVVCIAPGGKSNGIYQDTFET